MFRVAVVLFLFILAGTAVAGPIMAEVWCGNSCADVNYYATQNADRYYAEYYTGSGPSDYHGNGPGVPRATADAAFPRPMVYSEFLDPLPRVSAYAAPGFEASAEIEGTFALTITLDDGDSGYYLPCLRALGQASGTFGGLAAGRDLGPSDSCAFFPPMRAFPFESGVMQFVPGRFEATASGGEGGTVYFISMKVYDQDRNLLNWGDATMTLEYVPEPATLATLSVGLALLAAAAVRRWA